MKEIKASSVRITKGKEKYTYTCRFKDNNGNFVEEIKHVRDINLHLDKAKYFEMKKDKSKIFYDENIEFTIVIKNGVKILETDS